MRNSCVCHGPNVGAIPDLVNSAAVSVQCPGGLCGRHSAIVWRLGFEGRESGLLGLGPPIRSLSGIGRRHVGPAESAPVGLSGNSGPRYAREVGSSFERKRAAGWGNQGLIGNTEHVAMRQADGLEPRVAVGSNLAETPRCDDAVARAACTDLVVHYWGGGLHLQTQSDLASS